MTNAQHTFAVAVARQVIAKSFKRQISSRIVQEEHKNASSANQADERARYVSWSSARNSLHKSTYHNDTGTGPRNSMSVKHAVRTDIA